MSKLTYAEVESEVNDVIKEEPFNREDNVESTDNTDSNWEIKLEVEDYNLEDLHHVVDIKDELPFETHNEETNCIRNFENQHGTKRRLPCSLSEEEIIAVVSKKPKLWNPTLKDYKSENNLSLWQDVAQELGVSGEGLACKAKWDSLQEQYKNLKRSAENSQRAKKSKYTKKLSFLDPYLSFQQNLKREDCDNNLTAPGLSSSSEKDLNSANKIHAVSLLENLADTKESVICIEKTDDVTNSFRNLSAPIDYLKTEHNILEEQNIGVNEDSDVIQAEQLQKSADVALTLANQPVIRKHYIKLVPLERLAAVEERRAAVEERRAAVEERKAVAEERKLAAEEWKIEAEKRKTEAEKQKIAAKERRAAVEEKRAAAEERRAAVEERRAAVEERRAAVEERKAAAEKRKLVAEKRQIEAEKRKIEAEERWAAVEERKAAAEKRKLAAEERKIGAEKRMIEAEKQKIAAEERRAAVEERTAAAEERKLAVKKRKNEKKRKRKIHNMRR